MQKRDFDAISDVKFRASLRTPERQADQSEARSALALQKDPTAQVTCRVGDDSCATAHASTLNRASVDHPSRRVQSLFRLQKQYGNNFVQRVLRALGKAKGETAISIDVERAVQRAYNCGKAADRAVQAVLQRGQKPAIKATNQGAVQREIEEEEEEESALAKADESRLQQQAEEEEEPVCTKARGSRAENAVKGTTADRVQTKLTLGSSGDIYELEADRVAEEVSTFFNSRALSGINQELASRVDVSKVIGLVGVRSSPISSTSDGARGMRIFPNTGTQSGENRAVEPSVEKRIMQSRGKGSPLPAAIRNSVALQTGYEFGNVRVKTDSEAAALNKSLNARAFTLGSDIWMGENESVNDVKLMAHELTHVVQQGGAGRISPKYVAGFDRMKSKNKVLTYLQALTNGEAHDPSIYAKEIKRFQAENSPEMIAGLQRQILEKPKGVDISQKSDSQVVRTCAGCSRETTPTCPTQTVTMSGARCGAQYGAVGRYCYRGARNWWFKERVTMGSPNTCVPGATISQTTTPIQASGNCVSDLIFNYNGPPANVAPCTIVTNQTVFTGPTRATVEQCQYSNRQVVRVTETRGSTPRAGKVITSSAGVSTDCDWP